MSVTPYDEQKIGATDRIIRRISKQHVIWDHNRKCHRIASKAFHKSSEQNGGMSVDIEAKILEDNLNPQQYVTTPVFIGSVWFPAISARQLNLWVGYDPRPDNPYHGEVWGNFGSKHFSGSQERGLQNASQWYVPLDNVEIR